MTEFLQLVVVGVSTGSAFALVGIGMVLIYRTTNIVNFAQGSFAVLGGLFMVGLVDDMHGIVAGAIAVVLVALVGARWVSSRSASGRARPPREPDRHARPRIADPSLALLGFGTGRTPTRRSSSARGTSAACSCSRSTCSWPA